MLRTEIDRRADPNAPCLQDQLAKASLTMPKGDVDYGETPWHAAVRELWEEAGVPAADVTQVHELAPLRTRTLTAFVVRLAPRWEEPRDAWPTSCSETTMARWVPVSERASMWFVNQVHEILFEKASPKITAMFDAAGDAADTETGPHQTSDGNASP
jgi:8-oxo-dGTP pyrophosphatase MutT (NUDIX family)